MFGGTKGVSIQVAFPRNCCNAVECNLVWNGGKLCSQEHFPVGGMGQAAIANAAHEPERRIRARTFLICCGPLHPAAATVFLPTALAVSSLKTVILCSTEPLFFCPCSRAFQPIRSGNASETEMNLQKKWQWWATWCLYKEFSVLKRDMTWWRCHFA